MYQDHIELTRAEQEAKDNVQSFLEDYAESCRRRKKNSNYDEQVAREELITIETLLDNLEHGWERKAWMNRQVLKLFEDI